MNVKSEGKRIFGACLLLMMTVMAVYFITFAATSEQWDVDGTYSLVIKKEFNFEDIPTEIQEWAIAKEYTFKITGTRATGERDENGDLETVSVNETLTLPRRSDDGKLIWESEEYKSNGPINVIVTEITDNIGNIKDNNGKYYNMSDSSVDSKITVDSRKHELQLKNNSTLTIVRPEGEDGPEELWYRVINRPYEEHQSGSYVPVDEVFSLEKGGKRELTGLRAAIYTIEQIAAPDGYLLQLGEREETVAGGEKGHFHINGTPGTLILTAGGTRGDGMIHYYTIERVESEGDNSEYMRTTIPIQSGESYQLDNLPKGGYDVTEHTINASEKSIVTVPQTEDYPMSGKSSGLTKETKYSFVAMTLKYPKDFDVDYIKLVSFGPLYNNAGNRLNSSTSYAKFYYGICDEGGSVTGIKTHSTGYKGNITYTITNSPKLKVDNSKRLAFTTTGVKSQTAKTIGVSWVAYDEKETEKMLSAGISESVTVDERRWIKIQAPKLEDPDADGADQIAYYYTIKNSEGNLIEGTTDREDTTVKLLPGESIKLNLPKEGSYTVVETIEGNTPVGFTMRISGKTFGTTEPNKEITLRIGGDRDLTISKPALSKPTLDSPWDKAGDNRTYTFTVTGGNLRRNIVVEIKDGESKTVPLPKLERHMQPYRIIPGDKLGEYELGYTDSGAVYGMAEGKSSITFTNFFSPDEYGYRYVHEYYIREDDGTYTYEGNSQITTRLGREEKEIYEASQIDQVPRFEVKSEVETYTHFEDAYGWVDGLPLEAGSETDLEEDFSEVYNIVYPIASASSAQRHEEYSVASASSAQASLNIGISSAFSDEETDDRGVISKGVGLDTDGKSLNYAPDPGKEFINVTKDASQIVILRYYRDRQPKGSYNVIHVYYLRDEKGDHYEGDSGVLPQEGELNIKYDVRNVDKQYDFKPENAERSYTYQYEKDQYGVVKNAGEDDSGYETASDGLVYRADNTWSNVAGTEEGNQIIILRYYREPGEGIYNIVHEYYFREASESQDGETDDSQRARFARSLNDETETGENGEDTSGAFSGTVNRDDGYVYTFEGRSEIWKSDPKTVGTTFFAENIRREYRYNEDDYEFLDTGYGTISGQDYICNSNQQWATATEDGKEVIILRYYRDQPEEPEKPENPRTGSYNIVHEYYFRELSENQDGEEDDSQRSKNTRSLNDGRETDGDGEDISGGFSGTLNRDDGYVYTFEGNTKMKKSDPESLGDRFFAKDIALERSYDGKEYQALDTGYGTTSDHINYVCDPDQEWATATEEGEDVIILRYYREEESNPTVGAYSIVHEYYLKNKNGEYQLEGISEISPGTVDPLVDRDYLYTAKEEMWIEQFKGKDYGHWEDLYGKILSDPNDSQGIKDIQTASGKIYGWDSDMKGVYATEEGDQIIILRYVREEPETPPPDIPENPATGTYKVVHTYYLRDNTGDHFEGRSGVTTVKASLDDQIYTDDSVEKMPVSEVTGREYGYETAAYGYARGNLDNDSATTQNPGDSLYKAESGKTWVKATKNGDQIIILKYIRTEPEKPTEPTEPETPPDTPEEPTTGTYKVVHTYYLRNETGDHFEGRSGITTVKADIDSRRYTADSVEKKPVSEATGKEYGYETAAYGYASGNTDNDAATTQDPGDSLYKAESGMAWAEATESGNQIIILKYIRTEPEKPTEPTEPETPPSDIPEEPTTGTYKVVHTYYLRNETGDHFEGRSKITSIKADLDGSRYTSDSVEKLPTSEATGREYGYETSAYGYTSGNTDNDSATTQDPGDSLYKAESGKTWAEATESGRQIIILKYVRTEPPAPDQPDQPETPAIGSYKVVHMYYLRNSVGDHFEGRSGIETVEKELSDAVYTSEDVVKIPTCAANGRTYVYGSCAYGQVTGDTEGDQPTVQDPGDALYQENPEMTWVKATESGDEIIILKYYRQTNGGGRRPSSGSDSGTEPAPGPTPEPTEPASEPTPEPGPDPVSETPPEPAPERELPDPNAPDSPDRVTITEDGVPTTYVRVWDPETGEYRYIPEDEVPLWGLFLPKTGDISKSPLWGLLAMGSLGILWALWSRKSRKEGNS